MGMFGSISDECSLNCVLVTSHFLGEIWLYLLYLDWI